MSGYGSSWGSVPWGGGEPGGADFNLFCFDDCTALTALLSSPIVEHTPPAGVYDQFPTAYPPGGDTCDQGFVSGQLGNGLFPTSAAVLQIIPPAGISEQWTYEWTLKITSMPSSFGDLVQSHLYIGASSNTGPVGGLFISSAGLAYAGDIKHVGPDNTLVLNGPVQPIPGTAGLVQLGVYTTFRIAANLTTGIAYLYVTPTVNIPFIGQQLVAVLPALTVDGLPFPVIDRTVFSVKGTTAKPTIAALSQCCLSDTSLVPNLPPIADAGVDQAAKLCSILRLDGSASFDPEGVTLSYGWQLVDAPLPSSFTVSAYDAQTYPLPSPTGFTDKLHSVELANAHGVDPLQVGDVLRVGDATYAIVNFGSDVNGFYVELSAQYLTDSMSSAIVRVLRQRGLSNPTQAKATFLPDVIGFYRFSLVVNDGVLPSQPSIVVANVVEAVLPRGITPDLSFIFTYLSDFWNLVEGKERLEVAWSSLAQAAASELWTLWQLEYSKSLRDIQRFFVRRWLHYDLVLGEPLPELTTIRRVNGVGISIPFSPTVSGAGGTYTVNVYESAELVPYAFTMTLAGAVTAAQAAAELSNRLLEVDNRFQVTVVTKRDATQVLHVTAPIYFSINPNDLFPSGASNDALQGSSGTRVGPRSFRTGVTLTTLGLQENDILFVGTEPYLIAAVVDDASDNVPFQRVIVKSDIPLDAPIEWAIRGYVKSELLDFYNGLVTGGDLAYFEVVDALGVVAQTLSINILVATTVAGVSELAPSSLAIVDPPVAYLDGGDVTVRLAKVVRKNYVPIDKRVLDVPTLVEHIQMKDDTATLHFNLDFFRETFRGAPCLKFVDTEEYSVWNDEPVPERLWAEYTYLDNRELIEAHFGIPAEFTLDDLAELPGNVDYLSAVQGIWYALFGGPTLYNLRVGSQILLGLPFAEVAGTIEEIRTDFSTSTGRILIRDSERTEVVRSYTFVNGLTLDTNPATQLPYVVGDAVEQFAPLVRGVEVVDYVKDPKWIQGFVNQGVFYEIEKFHKFLVRIDSKAFNLASLLFARAFILKIKPRHTFPVFVVRYAAHITEVDVSDERHYKVRLKLDDQICSTYSSTIFDDVRSGGGGYWNQFDNQQGTSLPTYPVPDNPIDWGFDRYILCPGDSLLFSLATQFGGGPVPFDSVFSFDTPVRQRVETLDVAGPFTVLPDPLGLDLTVNGPTTIVRVGDIVRVSLFILGGPGSFADDYELIILLDGTPVSTVPFVSAPLFTELIATVSVPAALNAVMTARIRQADVGARVPGWTRLEVKVDVDSAIWTFDDNLPAAKYCGVRIVE